MATLSNASDNTIISGTNEADSLGNGNSNVTIYGYNGNDTIYSINRVISSNGVNTTVAHDNVSIDAGADNDYIQYSGGNYISITAGNGDDRLLLQDDSYLVIDLGDGNDTINESAGNNITINAGNGIDAIMFTGSDVLINADDGDDYIGHYGSVTTDILNPNYSNNVTINTGKGNDNIVIGRNDFIVYAEGDGNDTIQGYSVNDTIKIDSTSTPSTVASGNDIIINVGEGSIRLVNVTDTAVTAINSSGDLINFSESGTTSTVQPANTDTNVASGWATIISSDGSTVIDNDNNIANGTDNAETFQIASISNTLRVVYGNAGADTINISGSVNGIEFSNVTLEGGDGDDAINIYGNVDGIHPSTVSIGGGAGNDTVSIYGGNEGIHGGISEAVENKTTTTIDGGDGDDNIIIYANTDKGIDISKVTITGGNGNDLISIYGGNYGIGGWENSGGATVSIDGGEGADTISVNSIDSLSGVSIVAGSGDNISVGEGSANYLFDSTDAVTINGATFYSNEANTSANLVSYVEGTSIGSAWNGTVAISGTNSLADIDGSIVSDAGNYQIVDGKFAGTVDATPTVIPEPIYAGQNYDIVFIIDISGSMDYYIDGVKENVKNFATSLKSSGVGDIRFGLVSYETYATAKNFSTDETSTYLTSNVDDFTAALNDLSIYGGIEYGLTAVDTALSIVSDEDDTTKRFILITDEDFDDTNIFDVTDIDNKLKSREIVMDVVGDNDTSYDYCRSEWEPLANDTGGKFYLLGEGFPEIFNNIVTDIVNVVDLNLVPNEQTGYFVAANNSGTYTTPIFQNTSATGNDTTVGAVNEVYVYTADSDTDRYQKIIIPENWNVTATKNNDVLMINGSSVTVTGGEGSDVFNLGSDVSTVALMDLNINEDKLSFGNYIMPGTLKQTIEDNHLVLTADDLRVDLPAMSEMTEEFLNYSVSNAGTSSTIRELIYGDGRSIISFAQWKFSFTNSSSEEFSFFYARGLLVT